MRLGMLASKQLNGSLRAMSDFQEKRVKMLIDRDRELDELEAEINERVLMIITVRSPRADDLRRVLAATKAAQSLERIGDYARNVGKRTRAIMESEPGQLPWDQMIEIGTMVASMIDDVMAAYQEGDLETAQAIRNSDLHVDKLHTNIFRHVIEQMDEGKISALNGAHLLFIAKNIERMGDFTTSLAEQIMFVETGVMIDDKRPVRRGLIAGACQPAHRGASLNAYSGLERAMTEASAPENDTLVLADIGDGGILRLTLNAPKSRNALSEAMMSALSAALADAAADPAVRVIVIAANGPV